MKPNGFARIVSLVLALVVLMSVIVPVASAAAPTGPVLPDLSKVQGKVWVSPEKISADKPELGLTVLALDAKGPMAGQSMSVQTLGSKVDGTLNATGGLTLTIPVTTVVGTYIGQVAIGAAQVMTYPVVAGDTWSGYGVQIYGAYNTAFVDANKATALVAGQNVTVTIPAPSFSFKYVVVAGVPAKAVFKTTKFAAGTPIVLQGSLVDKNGNMTQQDLIWGSWNNTPVVEIGSNPAIEIHVTDPYTKVQAIPVKFYADKDAKSILFDGKVEIVSAVSSKLSVTGAHDVVAGASPVTYTVALSDAFGNGVPNAVVSLGAITRTTGLDGKVDVLYTVPTISQKINLAFASGSLSATYAVTVSAATIDKVEAVAQKDGSVKFNAWDAFGNPRVGDSVKVSVDVSGKVATITGTTTMPDPKPIVTAPITSGAVVAPATSSAPSTTVATAPKAGAKYTVVEKDTLWNIYWSMGGKADDDGTTWSNWLASVMKINGITDPAGLQIGQIITLPAIV